MSLLDTFHLLIILIILIVLIVLSDVRVWTRTI